MEISYTKKEKQIKTIFSLIILFFSIEYVGGEGLSVYRAIIFPLSCIGAYLTSGMPRREQSNISIMIWSVYFIYMAFCLLSNGGNWLFPLFTIPLTIFLVNFYSLKKPIFVSFPPLLVFFGLPHIIAYFMGMGFENGYRFTGMHKDPNYCGAFLAISLIAGFFLLKRSKRYLVKSLILFIVLLDLVLIFMTASRGAMLSVILVGVVWIIFSKIGKVWKVGSVIVLSISFFYLIQYINELPFWVSSSESLIDSILCRFKPENAYEGSGRTDLWEYALTKMQNTGYFLPIGSKAATEGFGNDNSHNLFVELMVETGMVQGIIFDFILAFIVFIVCQKSLWGKMSKEDSDTVSILVVYFPILFFLSALMQKTTWLCILIFFSLYHNYSYRKKFGNA